MTIGSQKLTARAARVLHVAAFLGEAASSHRYSEAVAV